MAIQKKRGRKPGSKGPTKADRIKRLTEGMSKADAKTAAGMVNDHSYDILALAYLTAEKPAKSVKAEVRGLGQEIDEMSDAKQDKAREIVDNFSAAIKALNKR